MRKNIFLFLIIGVTGLYAQKTVKAGAYQFEVIKEVPHTSVKDQQKTNTCWSFSACSFLESELIRTGKGDTDLSEMYVVRQTYPEKVKCYLNNGGSGKLSQGGLGHDVMNSISSAGIVPQSAFLSRMEKEGVADEAEVFSQIENTLKGWEGQPLPPDWNATITQIVNRKIGETPTQFEYNGKTFTPRSFADSMGINPKSYIGITSFLHHPYYESFAIEVPDNFSKGKYWNLPMSEFIEVVKSALMNGYSVIWDGDISNEGFSGAFGLAIYPEAETHKEYFTKVLPEKVFTEEQRQFAFDTEEVTDDHLMHLVGLAKASDGTMYFILKNSWGAEKEAKGYIYMSETYFSQFTVSCIIHKEAIPSDVKAKCEGM